ncbi:hypothetical protein [Yersinia enterocolitica]|uniref:hypothetical protein n=1 Tax=Yersinia enterocolitica TaxID=630 RepID=UPI001C8DBD0D|nr:hypothetical protein [Yersinia enterocolitica]MBX9476801.1 hypothetical protein [Yersinia enterocolitica]
MSSVREVCKKLSRSKADIGSVVKRAEEGNTERALELLRYQIKQLNLLADELEVNISEPRE